MCLQNQRFQKKKRTKDVDDPFAEEEEQLEPEEEVWVKSSGTKAASCAIRLQDLIPSARVVYVSATGARSVLPLAYERRECLHFRDGWGWRGHR